MGLKINSKRISDLKYIDYKEEDLLYAFLQGNETCAEAAILAGCNFFGGYPITPSSEIAEVMSRRLPQEGGVFIQMEDEIASIAVIIGASLGGSRSMTATSGPGFSLMQENLGYAITAEIPCVVVNVQRMGPSTGLPTSPAQGDLMQARWGTHGDHPIITLYPTTVQEVLELTVVAFDFAERLRTPVILLMDETIGHMRERVSFPKKDNIHIFRRNENPPTDGHYRPYRNDTDDSVPPFLSLGVGAPYHVTGLIHDEFGFPTRTKKVVKEWFERLNRKLEKAMDRITLFEAYNMEDADTAIVSCGISARTALEAMIRARKKGLKVGVIKLLTIWPFPGDLIREVIENVDRIIVPELNMGQLIEEIEKYNKRGIEIIGVNRYDGDILNPPALMKILEGSS